MELIKDLNVASALRKLIGMTRNLKWPCLVLNAVFRFFQALSWSRENKFSNPAWKYISFALSSQTFCWSWVSRCDLVWYYCLMLYSLPGSRVLSLLVTKNSRAPFGGRLNRLLPGCQTFVTYFFISKSAAGESWEKGQCEGLDASSVLIPW